MQIKLSKKQWEFIGKQAGWSNSLWEKNDQTALPSTEQPTPEETPYPIATNKLDSNDILEIKQYLRSVDFITILKKIYQEDFRNQWKTNYNNLDNVEIIANKISSILSDALKNFREIKILIDKPLKGDDASTVQKEIKNYTTNIIDKFKQAVIQSVTKDNKNNKNWNATGFSMFATKYFEIVKNCMPSPYGAF